MTATAPPSHQRLLSIDALRGLVILFMLLDHVRETFFLHRQVADPMNIEITDPALFFSRTLAHLCAPVFVLLTGLSAYLYGEKYQGKRDVSAFLFKRGLFLVVLEFTLVNFAWTFQLPPSVIYMQVIWAIGVSMIALAALVWLPRPLLLWLGIALLVALGARAIASALPPLAALTPTSITVLIATLAGLVIARTPLARAGSAEEVAEAVRWLLQDATYMTGEILRLDGGRNVLG